MQQGDSGANRNGAWRSKVVQEGTDPKEAESELEAAKREPKGAKRQPSGAKRVRSALMGESNPLKKLRNWCIWSRSAQK